MPPPFILYPKKPIISTSFAVLNRKTSGVKRQKIRLNNNGQGKIYAL
jgi:hypothetical protein